MVETYWSLRKSYFLLILLVKHTHRPNDGTDQNKPKLITNINVLKYKSCGFSSFDYFKRGLRFQQDLPLPYLDPVFQAFYKGMELPRGESINNWATLSSYIMLGTLKAGRKIWLTIPLILQHKTMVFYSHLLSFTKTTYLSSSPDPSSSLFPPPSPSLSPLSVPSPFSFYSFSLILLSPSPGHCWLCMPGTDHSVFSTKLQTDLSKTDILSNLITQQVQQHS